MLFSDFARQLDQLEQTSKRTELIQLLAELFMQANDEEIQPLVYLCQGRVAPFFEPIEIGMGEKMVAQAIAQAANLDRTEILHRYGQLGDLGLVAQAVEPSSRQAEPSDLNLLSVFHQLLTIATTNGDGSVEQKIGLLTDLITKLDSISAKHLVRIPLGTLRLGIGDPTILDAFSLVKAGDKSLRPELDRAYAEVSDLGLIGQTLWQQGIEGVKKLTISVGRPLRSQLTERLPNVQAVLDKMGPVLVQTKFDGFRVQIHKNGPQVEIFSRNLEDMSAMFPEIIVAVNQQIKAETAILDGEALAFNEASGEFYRFQETTKRRRKHNVDQFSLTLPLKAFLFDLMYLNGEPVTYLPLTDRLAKLNSVLQPGDTLRLAEGEIVDQPDRLQTLLDQSITSGLEGLVVKRPDSTYQAGARNFNWVKLKRHSSGELHDTVDCVILGYIYGRGKRTAFGAGALLVGVYDASKDEFTSVSKIGTGLTDQEWQEIRARCDKITSPTKPARINSNIIPSVWVEPEVVIEVLADEITRSPLHTTGKEGDTPGYALRFPRLVSFRAEDKQAEDATTVDELIKMYNQQISAEDGNGK